MCTFQPVFKSPLQQPAPSLTLTTHSVTDEGLGTMRRGLKWLVICMWFMLENIWMHKWRFIWPFSSLLVLNHECEVLLPSSAPQLTLKPEGRGKKRGKKDMNYHQPRGTTADVWSESALNSSDHCSVSRTTADGPVLLQGWLSILSLGSQGHKAPSN